MNVIRKRKARAATASVPEIAAYPECIDLRSDRRFQELQQSLGPPKWSIADIMDCTSVGVWVKDILESDAGECRYEV